MSTMSTPELSPADSLERPRARKQFRLPKELDILPPRPVLFPWLPNFEDMDCCKSSRRKTNHQRFSFDLSSGKTFGTEKISSSQAGTPTTAPMEDEEDDYEDAMPDMSKVHTTNSTNGKQQHYHRHRNHQQQPLLNLQDVIAEVLKVIFFMLSMKRSLLRQNGEENRKDIFYEAKSKQDKERNTSSTNSLVDVV